MIDMTELELFAKQTLEQGGEWYKLEEGLFLSKTKYLVGNYYFYNDPVYQVFNSEGKRLMVSTSYDAAYSFWLIVKESDVKDDKRKCNRNFIR